MTRLPVDDMDDEVKDLDLIFPLTNTRILTQCPPGKLMNGTGLDTQLLECGDDGWTKPLKCVKEQASRAADGSATETFEFLKFCMLPPSLFSLLSPLSSLLLRNHVSGFP